MQVAQHTLGNRLREPVPSCPQRDWFALTFGAHMCGARRFDIRTALAAALTIGLWASGFAGIRSGLHGYGAGELALLRLLVAAIVLVGYGCATRMRLPARRD